MTDLRRSTLLFSQAQSADSLYFVDSGLVKLSRNNRTGGRIILTIRGIGELVGEEALHEGESSYESEAEIIAPSSVYRIGKHTLQQMLRENAALHLRFTEYILSSQELLAEKIELLCLHDVEYRVLHYLRRLCGVVRLSPGINQYQIPMTQLEVADLIGATRETTSTVLNQLERRGLVQLSRRMLSVSSLPAIEAALAQVHEEPSAPAPVPSESLDGVGHS